MRDKKEFQFPLDRIEESIKRMRPVKEEYREKFVGAWDWSRTGELIAIEEELRVLDLVGNGLFQVVNGDKTPDDVLKELDEMWNTAVNDTLGIIGVFNMNSFVVRQNARMWMNVWYNDYRSWFVSSS